MSDERQKTEEVLKLSQRFVNLANRMKNDGINTNLVNTALMVASGTYATYLGAGNKGYLERSGVEKVTQNYATNLMWIQSTKKQQNNPDA